MKSLKAIKLLQSIKLNMGKVLINPWIYAKILEKLGDLNGNGFINIINYTYCFSSTTR